MEKEGDFLKSKDVQKVLKVQACEIMHLREGGELRFEKKDNAYLYSKEDVDKLMKKGNEIETG